jgi:hypothetical protein
MRESNYFTEVNPNFSKNLIDFKKNIMNLKLVKMRSGNKKTFNELIFLHFNGPIGEKENRK